MASGVERWIKTAARRSHPFTFVAAVVLIHFSVYSAHPAEVVRPIAIGWLVAALAVAVISFRLHLPEWAPLLTSFGILLLFLKVEPAAVVLALGLWWPAIAGIRRVSGQRQIAIRHPRIPNQAASVVGGVLLVSALWSNLSAPAHQDSLPPGLPEPVTQAGPDIFLLLLDGYPRSDSLLDAFGVDNSDFENRLEAAGFTVSRQARANYNKTWLTVPSILSASYVHQTLDLTGPIGTLGQQARRLHEFVNAGPVLDYLRERGYEINSIPSLVETTDITKDAVVHRSGWLSSLEASFVLPSAPGRIAPNVMTGLLVDELRGRLHAQFETLGRLATEEGSQPRFVFFHALSPHPPFILGQEPDYLGDCFPTCGLWGTTIAETGLTRAQYGERLADQIRVLNDLVIEAVDTIRRSNPDAVVLVLSDHGARHSHEELGEHFAVFFAARSPGEPEAFGGEISLVNVFRRLFSAYFDEPLADLDYAAWVSDWHNPLDLESYR